MSEQLGIGSLMDAGGVFSSATNIVELMQSRLMIEKTLRNTTQVGNRKLVFADFFLDSLDYRKKWFERHCWQRQPAFQAGKESGEG